MKNYCVNCKFGQFVGDGNSMKCHLVEHDINAYRISGNIKLGNITEITDKNLGTVITFDPVAAKAGLCNWPFRFDPERIECYIPLDQLEKIEL